MSMAATGWHQNLESHTHRYGSRLSISNSIMKRPHPPYGRKERLIEGFLRKSDNVENPREIRTRSRIDLVRLVLQLGFVSVAAAASILVNRNKVQEDQ